MQFQIVKSVLLKALSNVNGAVEKKNTIPVLQNVKIEVDEKKVSLAATDMDILVNSFFSAEITKTGSTTVPAQMFYDIVRKIPDNTIIAIEQVNQLTIEIKYGKAKYSLPTIEASEFPALGADDLGKEITVDAEKLAKMIDRTRFSISTDETRYYLNGLYLQSVKKDDVSELRCVATDGHRLALSYLKDSNLSSNFGVIIPKKSVAEIRRIIEGAGEIKISTSRVKIKIVTNDSTIISKLIDGEFPDYERALPKSNDKIVTVNKKLLFDAIDRTSTVANDKHRSIKLIIEEGKLTLQVNTSDGGFAYEEIDINYSGEKIETGFNSRYLMDVVGQSDKEELLIKFKDGNSPALVEPKDSNNLFVIMPIRV
jgi:DNA polymerase-3 subunit beta